MWGGGSHPTLLLPRDGDALELALQQRLAVLGDVIHAVLVLLLKEPGGTARRWDPPPKEGGLGASPGGSAPHPGPDNGCIPRPHRAQREVAVGQRTKRVVTQTPPSGDRREGTHSAGGGTDRATPCPLPPITPNPIPTPPALGVLTPSVPAWAQGGGHLLALCWGCWGGGLGPGGSLSPAVTAPDTHCKSAALSTFRKSCLALSKMSGSSLGTAGRREGGASGRWGGGEKTPH